ncbi:MAG TPA: hypothetical protein VKG23_05190 [Thermoanaerobaculia bacterium]|nr:hypothetical protein [Thermoanaerobaculia bacterium]
MSGKGKAVLAALATIAAFAVSCGKDSNTVASPNTLSAMSVAGTWSGTYSSNSTSCAAAPMTITIQQSGSSLSGQVTATSSCAPHGALQGNISGNMVTGAIHMQGCTGGGISGQVSNGVLTLAVGDFYRPLVTNQQVLMQGGAATLRQ